MKNRELIEILRELNPDAEVRIMTHHHEGDDVTDWQVYAVHDGWCLVEDHDMVSIEVNLDDRPGYLTYPEYDRVLAGFVSAIGAHGIEVKSFEDLTKLAAMTDGAISEMAKAGLVDTYVNAEGIEMVSLTSKGRGELPH